MGVFWGIASFHLYQKTLITYGIMAVLLSLILILILIKFEKFTKPHWQNIIKEQE